MVGALKLRRILIILHFIRFPENRDDTCHRCLIPADLTAETTGEIPQAFSLDLKIWTSYNIFIKFKEPVKAR